MSQLVTAATLEHPGSILLGIGLRAAASAASRPTHWIRVTTVGWPHVRLDERGVSFLKIYTKLYVHFQ